MLTATNDQPTNPPMMLDQNMLFWAFRYALGRRTGVPSEVAGCIEAHITELTSRNLHQIAGEIVERRDRLDGDMWLGDDCDVKTWLDLLVVIYEELARRGS